MLRQFDLNCDSCDYGMGGIVVEVSTKGTKGAKRLGPDFDWVAVDDEVGDAWHTHNEMILCIRLFAV